MEAKRNLMLVCLLGSLLLPFVTQAQFGYTTLNGQITITNYTTSYGYIGPLAIPDTISGLPVVAIGDDVFLGDAGSPGGHSGDVPAFTSVTIGKNVISIGASAFAGQYLTNIVFGTNITTIGDYAFVACNGLTELQFPSSLAQIGIEAFRGCYQLTSVTIPNSVISMGDNAFQEGPGLKAVYFQGNPPPTLDVNVFQTNVPPTFYYPVGTSGWPFSPLAPYYLVRNGGFDDTGDFGPWTVSGNGSGQITGPDVYSGPYAAVFTEAGPVVSGNKLIAPGTSSVLSQILPTQAGAKYLLSFAINGMTNGYGSVSWDGNTLVQQVFNPGWVKLQYVVTASSAATALQFSFAASVGNEPGTIAVDSVSVLPLPQIGYQPYKGSLIFSAFTGTIGANYSLDLATSLKSPVNWVPQLTNSSDSLGRIIIAATPSATGDNFWRIRSVP